MKRIGFQLGVALIDVLLRGRGDVGRFAYFATTCDCNRASSAERDNHPSNAPNASADAPVCLNALRSATS